MFSNGIDDICGDIDFNWLENDKIEVHASLSNYSLATTLNLVGSDALDIGILYKGDPVGLVQVLANIAR